MNTEVSIILSIMATGSYSYIRNKNNKETGTISYGKNGITKLTIKSISFEKALVINEILRENISLEKVLKLKATLLTAIHNMCCIPWFLVGRQHHNAVGGVLASARRDGRVPGWGW